MGALIFGIDIQGIVADATVGQLPDITLRRITQTQPTVAPLTGPPTNTVVTVLTSGIVSAWREKSLNSAPDVGTGFRHVTLIGKPLDDAGVIPRVDDEVITQDGTFKIAAVLGRDPATATYSLRCRV